MIRHAPTGARGGASWQRRTDGATANEAVPRRDPDPACPASLGPAVARGSWPRLRDNKETHETRPPPPTAAGPRTATPPVGGGLRDAVPGRRGACPAGARGPRGGRVRGPAQDGRRAERTRPRHPHPAVACTT